MTGRVKVLDYRLASVVADVLQMPGKAKHKGFCRFTNVIMLQDLQVMAYTRLSL